MGHPFGRFGPNVWNGVLNAFIWIQVWDWDIGIANDDFMGEIRLGTVKKLLSSDSGDITTNVIDLDKPLRAKCPPAPLSTTL